MLRRRGLDGRQGERMRREEENWQRLWAVVEEQVARHFPVLKTTGNFGVC